MKPITLTVTLICVLALLFPSVAPAGHPDAEESGNNLSFPVIWAEGIDMPLRGVQGESLLQGSWWWWWGTDSEGTPLSCPPDQEAYPLYTGYCEDGDDLTSTIPDTLPGEGALQVYLQRDPLNLWQAWSKTGSGGGVVVDRIDWGDNLESVPWYLKSKVRVEVVLFKDLPTPLAGFEMRHLYGWGTDEMHGTTGAALDSNEATVYSGCARLTIQKLALERDHPNLVNLVWEPLYGWNEPAGYGTELVYPPLYNMAVYSGGDGPGYYSAEINIKGRVIYGYTWDVRRLNQGAGDYRITFSFDPTADGTPEGVPLNAFFQEGVTSILLPAEETASVIPEAAEETGGGGNALLDYDNNLTFIDVRILEKNKGKR